jgi:SAM-dependent methyltransferase
MPYRIKLLWIRVRTLVRRVKRSILMPLGFDFYMNTRDRRNLETMILPYFGRESRYQSILFVGCAWYTRGYQRLFEGKNYWTIEIDPKGARFGAKQHIVDSLTRLHKHFNSCTFDVIICTGVVGFGLDEVNEIESAFVECYECLREGGVFVLGWHTLANRLPLPLEHYQSLKSFRPYLFPPLNTDTFLSDPGNGAMVNFYTK